MRRSGLSSTTKTRTGILGNLGFCGIGGFLLAIFLSVGNLQAKDIFQINDNSPAVDLLLYAERVVENCANEPLSLKEVLNLDQSSLLLVPSQASRKFSLGYNACEQWFRWRLDVSAYQAGIWWLQISPTFLDSANLYAPRADGSYQEVRMGDHVPHSERIIRSRHFLIPTELSVGNNDYYYLRVKTSSTLTLGLTLWQPQDFINFVARENLFYGALFGLTITAIVICLIGGAWFREPFYFVMTAFLFGNGLMHFTVNGFDQFLLYPENTVWPDRMLTFSAFAAGAAGVSLYLVFLRPRQFFPRFTVFCWGVVTASGAAALSSLLGFPSPLLSGIGAILVLTSMFILTLLMLRHRFVPALLMLILFVPQLLTLFFQIARNFSLLPMTFWTTHIWAVMSMLQIPFVALVVMLRVREQEKTFLLETEKARFHRDFFSMVAHELRTPLAVVSSALTNIELQTANTRPDLAPRFSRANLGLARLNTLIDNALAEDRLLDKGMQLQCQWISVEELISQLRELRTVEPPHLLQVTLPAEPPVIYADPHWLGHALLNLLDNAIKYSPAGGHIQVKAWTESQRVFIQVTDQGIGIPPEAVDKIFDKFFRADNALKLQGSSGMGLGLFLVHTVMSLHGGLLEYRPNPEGGSIFTCSFPLSG